MQSWQLFVNQFRPTAPMSNLFPIRVKKGAYRLLFLILPVAVTAYAREATVPEKHNVGFEVIWKYDHARSFANDKYGESKRPIMAFVWYPAAETSKGALTYASYFEKMSAPPERDSLLSPFSEALKQYSLNSFKEYSIGWHFEDWNADAENAFAQLLKTPFRAVENAPPVPSGNFPVILYHPGLGGNVMENAALCEHLAARGYIVISSSFHAQQSWADYFFCGTIANSLEDVDFLINAVAPAIPNSDVTRIGLMGHSFGAQAGYAYLARENNVIDAFVSLDNSFDYKTMEEIESPFYRSTSWGEVNEALTNGYENCRATVLNISGTLDDGSIPDYELVKRLFKTDIYLGTFSFPMLHESFLSEAALAYPLVYRHYRDSAEVAALHRDANAYEVLAGAVTAFFDHSLKGEELERTQGNGEMNITYQPPLSFPSKDSILHLFSTYGIDTIKTLYQQFQKISPRARMNLSPVLARMTENKETNSKIAFLRFLLDFHPKDWRLLKQVSDGYLDLNAKKEARIYYELALDYCDDFEVRSEIKEKLRLVEGR